VTTSLQGLGAFDELDDKALHMLGLHGTAYANMAVQKADLILALGARFDDRVTMNVSKFAPAAFTADKEGRGGIVHFEILPKNINKVVNATEAVEGDVSTNIRLLLPLLRAVDPLDASRKDWLSAIQEWKSIWPISDFDRNSRPELIKPQVVVERLNHLVENRRGDVFITTGVGQHQMWAAQHFRWRKPRSMITSGGLGTMGFGLPAAIGAKVAHPNALVIDIDGDASFSMTLTELSTAAQFNVGVKILLLNNDEQGMVTQLQNAYYEDRYAHAHHENPDFVKLAESMHVKARRVSNPQVLDESLAWLLETRGPALLEVVTDRKVPVLPTVPSGRGLDEFTPYSQGE
jgi:acetolactate synthase-1/2/3 large subunit